jgi:hypothetical protein
LLCVFFTHFSRGQDVPNPVIHFEKKEIDLGTITAGDSAVCFFELTNAGTYPLVIKEAFTTCGCTVASLPNVPLAPGEKDRIRVVIDTTDKIGKLRKIITIHSNATNSEEKLAVVFLVKKKSD